MQEEIKRRSIIHAIRWTFIDRIGKYLLVFISTLLLARLLGPKAFGLISMLYIFISISSLFIDFGMGGGLIRKQDLNDTDCSTFFYFNITVALFLYALIFFLAPYIALFYKEPQVTNLLRVLCLTIPINALTLIHKELLVKELRVKYVTRASLLATVVSSVLGVVCAYSGYGIWSIVILQISQAIIYMFLLWRFSKWVPSLVFSKESFREMFGFGLGLFLSSLLNTIFSNLYQVLIGIFFSISYAGLYYQAKRLFEIPVLTISNVVDSLTYPILVKFQQDPDSLFEMYNKIVKLLIFVSFPLTVLMLVLAERVVLILLGKEWLFSAQLLQIFSLSALFILLETINRSLFKIEGRTFLIFKLELIKKSIIVLTILLTYRYGIIPFQIGMVCNAAFSYFINQYFISVKTVDYRKIFNMSVNGLLMAIGVFYMNRFINNPYLSLLLSSVIGLLIYFGMGFIMKIQEQKWFFLILNNKFKS